jgi:hypothetical protein
MAPRTRALRDPKTGKLAGSVSLGGAPTSPRTAPPGVDAARWLAGAEAHDRAKLRKLLERIDDKEGEIAQLEEEIGECAREALSHVARVRFPEATHVTVLDIGPETGGTRQIVALSIEAGDRVLWTHPDEMRDPVAAELAPYAGKSLLSPRAVRVSSRDAVHHYRVALLVR